MAEGHVKFDWVGNILCLFAYTFTVYSVYYCGGTLAEDFDPVRASIIAFSALVAATLVIRRAAPGTRIGIGFKLGGFMFVFAVLTAIIVPVFKSAKAAASIGTCLSSAKQLALGFTMYAVDYDNSLPESRVWRTVTESPLDSTLRCPRSPSPWSFAMNAKLSKMNYDFIEDPAKAILVFEADVEGPNAAGGREMFANRHGTVGMLDGQAHRIQDQVWNPAIIPETAP